MAQIVQKYGSLIKKFPKNFSEKNESRCRGPWQKIDFFVKYSPVFFSNPVPEYVIEGVFVPIVGTFGISGIQSLFKELNLLKSTT